MAKNLGQVAAAIASPTAPSNLKVLWYRTNAQGVVVEYLRHNGVDWVDLFDLYVPKSEITNNVTTDNAQRPLSAAMGKFLNDRIIGVPDVVVLQGTEVEFLPDWAQQFLLKDTAGPHLLELRTMAIPKYSVIVVIQAAGNLAFQAAANVSINGTLGEVILLPDGFQSAWFMYLGDDAWIFQGNQQ